MQVLGLIHISNRSQIQGSTVHG